MDSAARCVIRVAEAQGVAHLVIQIRRTNVAGLLSSVLHPQRAVAARVELDVVRFSPVRNKDFMPAGCVELMDLSHEPDFSHLLRKSSEDIWHAARPSVSEICNE